MPNQTEIECYFKSSELAKLCKQGNDIVVKFKADYPPGKTPSFEITAAVFKKSGKPAAAKKILGSTDDSGGSTAGCPQPCH